MSNTVKVILGSTIVILLVGLVIFTSLLTSDNNSSSNDSNDKEDVVAFQEVDIKESMDNQEIDINSKVIEPNDNSRGEHETKSQNNSTITALNNETEMKIYTNEFFPDFELAYPNTWDLSINSDEGVFGSPDVIIELIKNEADKVSLTLNPLVARGCSDLDNFSFNRKVSEDIVEFKHISSNSYVYTNNEKVSNCVVSDNISSKLKSNNPATIKDSNSNLLYSLTIYSQYDSSLLEDVTKILTQSKFE